MISLKYNSTKIYDIFKKYLEIRPISINDDINNDVAQIIIIRPWHPYKNQI